MPRPRYTKTGSVGGDTESSFPSVRLLLRDRFRLRLRLLLDRLSLLLLVLLCDRLLRALLASPSSSIRLYSVPPFLVRDRDRERLLDRPDRERLSDRPFLSFLDDPIRRMIARNMRPHKIRATTTQTTFKIVLTMYEWDRCRRPDDRPDPLPDPSSSAW